MPPMAVVGAYMIPTGVVTGARVHFAPTPAVGSNEYIWLVEETLMLNPPNMYILLPVTAKPPGRMVPAACPGQLSAAVRVVAVGAAGVEKKTPAVDATGVGEANHRTEKKRAADRRQQATSSGTHRVSSTARQA